MRRPRTTPAILLTTALTLLAVVSVPLASVAQTSSTSSLLVKLIGGLTPDQQAQVIARNGGVEISSIPALRLHVIQVAPADLPQVLANYQSDPQVVSAEENRTRQSQSFPADPLYPNQWSLPKIGWDLVYGNVTPAGSAIVAILDTGVDAQHPDLAGNVIPGTSILDGSSGTTDPSGHGTWVAGIVAGRTDATPLEGIAGVAYAGVRVMPVTVLDANGLGQDSDVIAGVIWAADHGADVIVMAFSNPGFSQNLQDAIDYAWSKNVVLVAATGNDALNTPTFPAGDRGVMGVSGTDPSDTLVPFSNYGQSAFIAAPATDIQTTEIGDAYSVISGTSASAAIVAGAAAFMKAVDPTLTNGIIVGRLARMADPAGTQDQTGNGRINMARALADTGTDFIQPAGAAPVGDGGPFVGPYQAAVVNGATITVRKSDCATTPGVFIPGDTVCASIAITTNPGANNDFRVKWFNSTTLNSTTLVRDQQFLAVTGGTTVTDSLTLPVSPTGTWTVQTCRGTGAGTCSAGLTLDTKTFVVSTAPKLTVTKTTVPAGDTGKFNLQINGTTYATDVGNGGTTGAQAATIGSNSVAELGGTGTSLTDYIRVIGGHCAADGSITLAAGDVKSCTITNTRKPKLTVTKITVPVGDTGKFNLQINGTTYATDVGNGGTTGAQAATIGSNSVAELGGTGTSLTDYIQVIGGDCAADGSITLAAGDVKSCTITNTRKPKLTVTKTTVPAGDTGKFNLQINGTTYATDVGNGGTTGAQAATIGSNSVAELGGTGTSLTDYIQVIGGDCAADGSITLAAGDVKSCTITNTRKPKLTVTKVVINDNGGTKTVADFPLFVDGSPVTSGVQVTVTLGNHTVSETSSFGYAASITGDCAADGSITLNPGDVKSCIITNDDIQPKLIVVKHVINNNGGTAVAANFTLSVTGSSPSPASFAGAESPGTAVMLNAGVYSVIETGPSGYAASFSTDCSETIAVGQIKTCTVTNDDLYIFFGFFSPIDNAPVVNVANSGQTMPVKWRITTLSGVPVSDPASFVSLTSSLVACDGWDTGPGDLVTEYAAGSSGLQYLGDGKWQFNWKTPKTYGGQCRMMVLTLSDGTSHIAYVKFAK